MNIWKISIPSAGGVVFQLALGKMRWNSLLEFSPGWSRLGWDPQISSSVLSKPPPSTACSSPLFRKFQESQCLSENGDNWVFLEQPGRAMNDLEGAGCWSEAPPALPPLLSFAETFIAASSSAWFAKKIWSSTDSGLGEGKSSPGHPKSGVWGGFVSPFHPVGSFWVRARRGLVTCVLGLVSPFFLCPWMGYSLFFVPLDELFPSLFWLFPFFVLLDWLFPFYCALGLVIPFFRLVAPFVVTPWVVYPHFFWTFRLVIPFFCALGQVIPFLRLVAPFFVPLDWFFPFLCPWMSYSHFF